MRQYHTPCQSHPDCVNTGELYFVTFHTGRERVLRCCESCLSSNFNKVFVRNAAKMYYYAPLGSYICLSAETPEGYAVLGFAVRSDDSIEEEPVEVTNIYDCGLAPSVIVSQINTLLSTHFSVSDFSGR